MKWKIFENGVLINTIEADEEFCQTYCSEMNYSYELIVETPTNPPKTIEDLEQENKILRAQIQAESDRSDFIEDCIAEMAGIVYA